MNLKMASGITMKMNKKSLNEALDLTFDISLKSGKSLMKNFKRLSSLTIESKEAQGVASTADYESEKIIIREIKKRYPDHKFLAEESAYEQFKGKTEAYEHFKQFPWTWIIDPLDGTSNYLNGLDYFAVCISLAHYGEPVLGLVYRPTNGDCFYALKGEKTKYKNLATGKKSRNLFFERNNKSLKESLLVTGFASEKGVQFEKEFKIFRTMMSNSRGVRRMGSAALDLCYLAQGVFDGFWERGLQPWDISAAGLICKEAGVKISGFKGEKFHPFSETVLAAREPVYKKLRTYFK